jgi:hypothetical protein
MKGKARLPGATGVRRWIELEDATARRRFLFDLDFLTSTWSCRYGCGCRGLASPSDPAAQRGCCDHGAYLTGEVDRRRVLGAAGELDETRWQFARASRGRVLARAPGGSERTRVIGGACVFLNRPGFPGGAGCALHRLALETGRRPLELKPDVCWQLPLRRTEVVEPDGSVLWTITEWRRAHWGPGGADFGWWCTEDPRCYPDGPPVWQSMRAELEALVGEPVYRRLASRLSGETRARSPKRGEADPRPTVATIPLRAPRRQAEERARRARSGPAAGARGAGPADRPR